MSKIGFQIQIQPIMTDGKSGSDGNFLMYQGTKIQDIVISIKSGVNYTIMNTSKDTFRPTKDIDIYSIDINQDISNSSLVQSHISLTITDGKYLQSDLIKLFRVGDLISISNYYTLEDNNHQESLFKGQIAGINLSFDINGINIDIDIDSLTKVLQQSTAVQFKSDRFTDDFEINTIASGQYVFEEIINKLFDGTVLTQSKSTKVKCYRGLVDNNGVITKEKKAGSSKSVVYEFSNPVVDPLEPMKSSLMRMFSKLSYWFSIKEVKGGTALHRLAYIYMYLSPTASKLNIILSTIYPYQRIMYADKNGDIIFTPLSSELDNEWLLDIENNIGTDNNRIPALSYNKSTSLLDTNRVFMPYTNAFVIMNTTKNPGDKKKAHNPQSVSIPSDYFKREHDITQSGIGTRTQLMQNSQSVITAQNSGIFNILNSISKKKIEGLKGYITTGNKKGTDTSKISQQNEFFSFSSVYSSNKMAEKLFSANQWIVSIPFVSTIKKDGTFREIPINKTIMMGKERLFVYGYNLRWSSKGTILTLRLCKPYTLKALWADKVEEL